jgi:hypothetical protein
MNKWGNFLVIFNLLEIDFVIWTRRTFYRTNGLSKLIGDSFVNYNLDRNQHSHYKLRKPGFHLNIGRARIGESVLWAGETD